MWERIHQVESTFPTTKQNRAPCGVEGLGGKENVQLRYGCILVSYQPPCIWMALG